MGKTIEEAEKEEMPLGVKGLRNLGELLHTCWPADYNAAWCLLLHTRVLVRSTTCGKHCEHAANDCACCSAQYLCSSCPSSSHVSLLDPVKVYATLLIVSTIHAVMTSKTTISIALEYCNMTVMLQHIGTPAVVGTCRKQTAGSC